MAISQSKYVQITSGVGGAAAAAERESIARLFSSNSKIPAGVALEFTSAANVQLFFGSESPEYAFSVRYFGYVNKYQSTPDKISFYRYAPDGTAPFMYASVAAAPITSFQAVTDGGMILSMGGVSYTLSGIDLSSVTDYASVAAALQTAVRANTAGGALWTQATVAYNAQDTAFVLTGGEVGESAIVAAQAPATGTDLSALVKWDIASAPLLSQGCAAKTITQIVSDSDSVSNNYYSFAFLETLTNDQIAEVAQWNHGQNNKYFYHQRVTPENYAAVRPLVQDYDGTSLEYDAFADDSYLSALPMANTAATDFNRVNGTVGYMYTQLAGMPVSVSTDTLAQTLDAAYINYYGATQQAGQPLSFYQNGVLQGSVTDQSVYANEIWLKDAMATQFLNYQIAAIKWAANKQGVSAGTAMAQDVMERAKNNGTFSPGKELTAVQKAYITQLTADEDAWREVYANGCYFTAKITQEIQNGQTVYVFKYTLVYSKGDLIRKVEGSHTLI